MFPEVPRKFPSIMTKLKTATAVEINRKCSLEVPKK
jgi:hypothetical protein